MYRLTLLGLTLAFLFSCQSTDEPLETDPKFGEYVFAFTSGTISAQDPIVIKLAGPYKGPVQIGQELPDNILDFDPEIKGKALLEDSRTILFEPDQKLKSDQLYRGTLYLSRFIRVDDEYSEFAFEFKTIKQDIEIFVEGMDPVQEENLDKVNLKAKIHSADHIDIKTLEKRLEASQDGKALEVLITSSSPRLFNLNIQNIIRKNERSTVSIKWDIPSYDISASREIEIPAISEFEVISVQNPAQNSKELKILFSDPIKEQELDGLIKIEGAEDLSFTINKNEVRVFTKKLLFGDRLLEIEGEILNIASKQMGDRYSKVVRFSIEKPKVSLLETKNIIPTGSGKLLFPFDAVGLSAVDVYVTKVFTNNIIQYFQENNLGKNYSLTRVGRHIYRKKIALTNSSSAGLYDKSRYYIELSELVDDDPGALYEIDIRFKKEYSLYGCSEEINKSNENIQKVNPQGWITDGEYYVDNYWEGIPYNWRERENPCHEAYYYRYNTSKKTTVMATHIGLTAKIGGDKQIFVAANDLISADPLSGVELTLFDYQQQEIAKGRTDSDGFALIPFQGKPFLVKAKHNKSTSYIKVQSGNALSVSKFQVQGSTVQDGVKAFIYGERGVWRPGDSLFLNFILDDPAKMLPKDHPVSLEIFNPRGQKVEQLTSTESVNGFYSFKTKTDSEAETGNYTALFKLGNRSYRKTLKIETVKPNRLKIALDISDSKESEKLKVGLESSWLHGSPGSGLKARVDLSVKNTVTRFEDHPGFHFDNYISSRVSTSEMDVFEGKLDGEGKADFTIDLEEIIENAPGKIKLSFNTKVFEPGGNMSLDYYKTDYSPYNSYVGLRIPESDLWGGALETDKEQTIEVISVDDEGRFTENKEVEISLYRVDRRWWFDNYSRSNYNYRQSNSYNLVESKTLNLSKGKANYKLKVDKEDWGRFVLEARDPVSGHKSVQFVFFDWPYWMRANRTGSDASTILGFSSDKEVYEVGEEVKLTIPTPEHGRVLLSLENGTEILHKEWINPVKGETHYTFTTTADMAPNIYAHISLIQPHNQTENDRPMRMYGVVPVSVVDKNTLLKPIIETADVYRPETTVNIKISEKKGRKMTYTLAVVDEGLLSLTRYKTPNPWNTFYAKEALGVRTWDLYDQVLGAFNAAPGNVFAIGGDEEGLEPARQKAIRFKPMVRFYGPFELGSGKKKNHEIEIPNYMGAVRVMVVAGMDQAYGNAEKEVPVRSKLMVLGTLPRVASPTETIQVPVNVFALEEEIKNVSVSIRTNDRLEIQGSSTKNLSFSKTGDKLLNFTVKSKDKIGIARVFIEATSGKNTSKYEVELDIRVPNPEYTRVYDTLIDVGQSWTGEFETFGIEGTNSAVIELSVIPPLNLEKRLNYLIRYPHGCIEQITSAGFPQLFLGDLMDVDVDKKVKIREHVEHVLRKYRSYQLSSGGFSYWPGSSSESEWGSSYAGHFMLLAEKNGYPVDPGIKSAWIRFQENQARTWASATQRNYGWSQRIQAYRLYTLALAREPDFSSMNALKAKADLNQSAIWILALAYAESGQVDVAKEMLDGVSTSIKPYREMGHSYGSDLRDRGFVLQTLLKLNRKTQAAGLARSIAEEIGSESWYSTQTLAYSLASLAEYAGKEDLETGLQGTVNQGNQSISFNTGKSLVQKNLELKGKKVNVRVTNEAQQPLFARVLVTGAPLESQEEKLASKIKMEIRYLDNDYNPLDVTSMAQGTDFIAEVRIRRTRNYEIFREMALTQLFPSGWEILNPRMGDGTVGDIPDYQDIRDDRIYSYFDLPVYSEKVFRVRLNASYKGRFYLPAVKCAAMYDNSVIAVEPGKWVEVK